MGIVIWRIDRNQTAAVPSTSPGLKLVTITHFTVKQVRTKLIQSIKYTKDKNNVNQNCKNSIDKTRKQVTESWRQQTGWMN